jgi:hypothetical protein
LQFHSPPIDTSEVESPLDTSEVELPQPERITPIIPRSTKKSVIFETLEFILSSKEL